MHHTSKTALVALASLALIPAAATAHTVKSPFPGTITATTYYPSGGYHGAIDVSSGRCNYWGAETAVVGSVSWTVTIKTTGVVCNGNGYENANMASHTWADGWKFTQKHFIKTADSKNRTCDRCQVGNEGGTGQATGPHAHLMQDKLGTKDTSWYSGYTVQGEAVTRDETLGVLD
ncbi:hypothetical protein POL68_24735 [Stigmatella sp. ncwal1]|uniref:Uncharacterized protein n=1 Tax=Stigmatella ashevillensis TaxID=2995309 RepID=A0ABT5DDJ8_9BACT|nr:hypothetical protein [Stigmatella ashevillena]MDC0711698.1 hypothetical protein [Stigmatella ashevillena]